MLKFRKGDTLVEVMLAIGVFSMVAISVVAVVSSSSAGAEMNLETSLTREEIDAQADALRFIQTAAVADHTAADSRFNQLWLAMIKKAAIIDDNTGVSTQEELLQFAPETCNEVYEFNEKYSSGADHTFGANFQPFIVNTRALGEYASQDYSNLRITPDDVLLTNAGRANPLLTETKTYPRLVFGDSSNNSDTENLISNNLTNDLYQAEGLYVIAVADPKSTYFVGGAANDLLGYAAVYYDFYIRSCWYGVNATRASTISTVIRLHNPNVAYIDEEDFDDDRITDGSQVHYYAGSEASFIDDEGRSFDRLSEPCPGGECNYTTRVPIWNNEDERSRSTFLGWVPYYDQNATPAHAGERIDIGIVGRMFMAKWRTDPYIEYYADTMENSKFSDGSTRKKEWCVASGSEFVCNPEMPIAGNANYAFTGWSEARGSTAIVYRAGEPIRLTYGHNKKLYAVYEYAPEIAYDANGGEFWEGTHALGSRLTLPCTVSAGCQFPTIAPTRAGYILLGFAPRMDATTPVYRWVSGNTYNPNRFNLSDVSGRVLYAIWEEANEDVQVHVRWNRSGQDYDSYIFGYDSNDPPKSFSLQAYTGGSPPLGVTVDQRGRRINDSRTGNVIGEFNQDCTSGNSCDEWTELHTLGGNIYYLYIHDWTHKPSGNFYGLTITVTGLRGGDKTFTPICSGPAYLDVFVYYRGRVFGRGTCNSAPDIRYVP